MKIRHFAAGLVLAAAVLLAGCAGGPGAGNSPEMRWAKAQSAFNAAVRQAINGRKPCVQYGEDAPDCLIPDAHYPVVNLAIMRGAVILQAVGDTTPAQGTVETVLAIAAEIVAAIPVRRE